MAKTLLTVTVLIIGSTALTACNTVEGFGEDLQDAGRSIDEAFD